MEKVRAIMNRYNSMNTAKNGKVLKKKRGVTLVVQAHSGSGSSFAHCYGTRD